MKQFLKRLMLGVVTLAMFCCVTPLAFADNPNYYTIYLERQGGIGTPEYIFVYRIKTSDGTEIYRTSRLPTPTMEGYLFGRLSWFRRGLALAGGLMMIYPGTMTDVIGLVLSGAVVALTMLDRKRQVAKMIA